MDAVDLENGEFEGEILTRRRGERESWMEGEDRDDVSGSRPQTVHDVTGTREEHFVHPRFTRLVFDAA